MAASQAEWRGARQALNGRRAELARFAAGLYRPESRVDDLTLAPPEWIPAAPIPLDAIRLHWDDAPPAPAVTGGEPESAAVRPWRTPGRRFSRYTAAMGRLARPTLFEDRASYRLLAVDLGGRPALTFGLATYFEKLDVAEAVGHELAVAAAGDRRPDWADVPFRALVGDPFDLERCAVIAGITTLTVRRDRRSGAATFLLHWRDPGKVAAGGGLHGLIPMGEFQPSTDALHDRRNDFDLWRNVVREYSEELLGAPERDGRSGLPLDYDGWDLYRALAAARTANRVAAHCLGVSLNALTLTATIMTVVVFDADAYDELFAGAVAVNEEGSLVSWSGGGPATDGVPFDHDSVTRLLRDEPMASSAACTLRRAWALRDQLMA